MALKIDQKSAEKVEVDPSLSANAQKRLSERLKKEQRRVIAANAREAKAQKKARDASEKVESLESRLKRLEAELKAHKSPKPKDPSNRLGAKKNNPYPKDLPREEIDRLANTDPTSEEVPDQRLTEYSAEIDLRRKQVARLMLRGVPIYTIASYLKVSHRTVMRDAEVVRKQWSESIGSFDISTALGESMAFYREARNIALRTATDTTDKGIKMSDKLNALKTAITSESDMHKFLQAVGVYDLFDLKALTRGEEMTDDGTDFENFLGDLSQAIDVDRDPVSGDFGLAAEDSHQDLNQDFTVDDDFTDTDI